MRALSFAVIAVASCADTPHADTAQDASANSVTPDAAVAVHVFACDALSADAGWEKITPPWDQTTAPGGDGLRWVLAVAPDPVNPGTVYTHTSSYGGTSDAQKVFWKTTDCGMTWTQVATGMNSDALRSGLQWQITVDPVTAAIYTHSFYGTGHLYKSVNGGVDWNNVSPSQPGAPSFVQGWAMDPLDHNHLFLTFHDDCTMPDGSAWGADSDGGAIHTCYAETHDGAATWQIRAGRTEHWEEGAGPLILGGDKIAVAVPFGGLYVSNNDATSWQNPIGYAGCFASSAFISGAYYIGCFYNNPIITSKDGLNWQSVPNSPHADYMVVTGRYLYAQNEGDTTGQPLWRAPLSDLTAWENVPTPHATNGNWIHEEGPLAYDATHHVLYMSLLFSGLYRMVTE